MKRQIWNLLLIVSLVLTLFGCAQPTPAVQSQATTAPSTEATKPPAVSTIKLGGFFPLTGGTAKVGIENRQGLQMAIDEINAAGGIKSMGGAKIEMVWGDSQGKPDVGISEVERLVQQENVVAILGGYESSVSTPATQAAERLKTPFIVAASIADTITERGFKYTFRVASKASYYARDQVEFLKSLKDTMGLDVKKVALLHEDTDYGESTAVGQKKYLQEAGMEMTIEVKYPSSAADLTTEVSKVKSTNPDAVLVVTYLNDAILLAQGREALGMKNTPFVDAAGGSLYAEFTQRLGATAEGWLSIVEFSPQAPKTKAINDRYKAKYGVDFSGNSALNYQVGMVIWDALERAASLDRDAVRDAIAKTKLTGDKVILPMDTLYFDETGQNPQSGLYVGQVQNGQLIPVWPPAGAVAKLQPFGK